MAREEGDKEGISAGRFVDPNLLPPTRTIKIQGAGRGISGGRLVNPGPYGIGIDYENSYHFGEIAAISGLPTGTNLRRLGRISTSSRWKLYQSNFYSRGCSVSFWSNCQCKLRRRYGLGNRCNSRGFGRCDTL